MLTMATTTGVPSRVTQSRLQDQPWKLVELSMVDDKLKDEFNRVVLDILRAIQHQSVAGERGFGGIGKTVLTNNDCSNIKAVRITSQNPPFLHSSHTSYELQHHSTQTPKQESIREKKGDTDCNNLEILPRLKNEKDKPSSPIPIPNSYVQNRGSHLALLLIATALVGGCLHGAFGAPGLPLLQQGNRLNSFVLCNSIVFFSSLGLIMYLLQAFVLTPWFLMLVSSAIGVYICGIVAFSPQLLVPVLFIATSMFLVAFVHIIRRKLKTPTHILISQLSTAA